MEGGPDPQQVVVALGESYSIHHRVHTSRQRLLLRGLLEHFEKHSKDRALVCAGGIGWASGRAKRDEHHLDDRACHIGHLADSGICSDRDLRAAKARVCWEAACPSDLGDREVRELAAMAAEKSEVAALTVRLTASPISTLAAVSLCLVLLTEPHLASLPEP